MFQKRLQFQNKPKTKDEIFGLLQNNLHSVMNKEKKSETVSPVKENPLLALQGLMKKKKVEKQSKKD
jgi:hypothetical protein